MDYLIRGLIIAEPGENILNSATAADLDEVLLVGCIYLMSLWIRNTCAKDRTSARARAEGGNDVHQNKVHLAKESGAGKESHP